VPSTVLLDLYGTLVEPDWPALLKGRAALAARAGVDAGAARDAWDGTHSTRMTGAFGSLADDLAAFFSEASGGSRSAIAPAVLGELAAKETENWSRGVRLYPDVVSALRLIRSAGSRLAIVTNSSVEAASVVDALGLRSLVDRVFASCEAGVVKPDLLDVALQDLRVDAVDATLIDDEPAQLDAAARLGVATILIDRAGAQASADASVGSHRAVSDLQEAVHLVVPAEPAGQR
jgi:putative hydrolase of the HAD superfamily